MKEEQTECTANLANAKPRSLYDRNHRKNAIPAGWYAFMSIIWFICSVLAIALGSVAIHRVKTGKAAVNHKPVKGLAIAGICLTIVGFGPLGLILSSIALSRCAGIDEESGAEMVMC